MFTVVFVTALTLSLRLGTQIGIGLTSVTTVVLVSNARVRGVLTRWLTTSMVRRQWRRAAMDARRNVDPPRVLRVAHVPTGEKLTLKVANGDEIAALDAAAQKMAGALKCSMVKVTRDPARPMDASRAQAVLVRRDPFMTGESYEWPHLYRQQLSMWEPIPVAVDEDGYERSITLVQRNLLLGGEPGSGKSVGMSQIVATAALDPDVDLYILDGKDYEMTAWTPCCKAFVGLDGKEALDVLKTVQEEMNGRKDILKAEGARAITRSMGLKLIVVVMDEMPYYASLAGPKVGSKALGTALMETATDLVRRGRAPGVIFIGAAQKPSHDVIPTSLRDLIGYRWAFRSGTAEASDMILGTRAASQGYDASTIPPTENSRGIGWLAAEEAVPLRVKAFHLTDSDIENLARRAHGLRADEWLHRTLPDDGRAVPFGDGTDTDPTP